MYDNDKSVETTGLYSYTVTAPVERRMLRAMPRVYVNGGSEEEWMNRLADAMIPYLDASGIRYVRNTPDIDRRVLHPGLQRRYL